MISFCFKEKGDCALLVPYQRAYMVTAKGNPLIQPGEDVSGDEGLCTWEGFGNMNDVTSTREGCEAWNIGLKVDTTEEEGDLVGGPEHFGGRLGGCGRRAGGSRGDEGISRGNS